MHRKECKIRFYRLKFFYRIASSKSEMNTLPRSVELFVFAGANTINFIFK